jgi:hypothetical protein
MRAGAPGEDVFESIRFSLPPMAATDSVIPGQKRGAHPEVAPQAAERERKSLILKDARANCGAQ